MTISIEGNVAPGFERVADAFARGFANRPGMGAALAIRVDGGYVARLWAGTADTRTGRPWQADTPSVIFSCTKGVMSLLVARLVEQGLVDYDAPMARYWPEFAAGGKAAITVREALSHRAGLLAVEPDLTVDDLCDWELMVGLLAAQQPLFPPDSGYAYHPITHGWLTGELVRRVTGQMPGAYLSDEITTPLGADLWIGIPETVEPTYLRVIPGPAGPDLPVPVPNWPERAVTFGGALPGELASPTGGFNDRRLLAAELPGAGGVATADGLATFWSAAVTRTEGLRTVGPDVIERATREVSGGPGIYPGVPPWYRWGMGFMLDADARRLLSPRSFGHDGAGGQVAFADPEYKVGFAYLTNQLESAPDPRGNDIVTALREILGS
jgi:CubicO group peptidase (beta-lactamase class C family)